MNPLTIIFIGVLPYILIANSLYVLFEDDLPNKTARVIAALVWPLPLISFSLWLVIAWVYDVIMAWRRNNGKAKTTI